ncbi:MAG: ATP-binding protein [Kineosporiaceae bacterium]
MSVSEVGRDAALRALDLLEAAPDARFDRIARLAARLLDVPAAVVSDIDDDRHVTKASHGRAGPAVGTRSPLGETPCRAVVDEDGPVVVDDAPLDPRVADLPCVREGFLRAYAGHPIRVAGRIVGTVCVMDTRPRSFGAEDVAVLADLAGIAEAELRAEGTGAVARRLDDLHRQTELVLGAVAEGVLGVDTDGAVTFVNDAACELLGWSPQELIGENLHQRLRPREADGSEYPNGLTPVRWVLQTGEARRQLHGQFRRRDGVAVPVDWSVGPVLADPDGDAGPAGAVLVFEDATRRVQVEQMKAQFIAVASHELRTPLTSLKGALELIDATCAGQLPPAAVPLLDIARRNATRLAQLVDDIVDVERLARGSLPILRKPVQVSDLMRTAAATVAGAAIGYGVEVEVEPLECTVWGDEHRLVQVLTNLLGNALRFSEAGGVVRLHADKDAWAVRISVTDTGVGIPGHVLSRVFDRFWQVDASDTRSRSGSGLGLTIAKDLVEAHGGFVLVESEVGHGSTFTVCLPVRSRPRGIPGQRSAPSAPGSTPSPAPVGTAPSPATGAAPATTPDAERGTWQSQHRPPAPEPEPEPAAPPTPEEAS